MTNEHSVLLENAHVQASLQGNGNIIVTFKSNSIVTPAEITAIGDLLLEGSNNDGNGVIEIAKQHNSRVILDIENQEFISSGFLNKLVLLGKRADQENVEFIVAGVKHSDVKEMFRVTRMNRALNVQDINTNQLSEQLSQPYTATPTAEVEHQSKSSNTSAIVTQPDNPR